MQRHFHNSSPQRTSLVLYMANSDVYEHATMNAARNYEVGPPFNPSQVRARSQGRGKHWKPTLVDWKEQGNWGQGPNPANKRRKVKRCKAVLNWSGESLPRKLIEPGGPLENWNRMIIWSGESLPRPAACTTCNKRFLINNVNRTFILKVTHRGCF